MVTPKLFDIGEAPNKDIFIALGSFDRNILDIMINNQYYKTNKDNELSYYYKTMFSHILEMRNDYFKIHNKNILDNTLFVLKFLRQNLSHFSKSVSSKYTNLFTLTIQFNRNQCLYMFTYVLYLYI
jgi:hypothetical protein